MARIQYDYSYKGVSFSDTLFGTNRVYIESVTRDVKLRTEIFNRENGHGSISGTTLASGRLFSFSGKIIGYDNATLQVGLDLLNQLIAPQGILGDDEFYELKWKDWNNDEFMVMAKVYSMPQYTRETASPTINFTFELYADEATYTSTTLQSQAGGMGTIGGWVFPALFPLGGSGVVGGITVNNGGTFPANVRIEVTGTAVNPKIINLTNSRYYGLNTTTTDLVMDNTERPMVVTDAGVNVAGNRMAGSKGILLQPGNNTILLHADNYLNPSVSVTVKWRDTSIHT